MKITLVRIQQATYLDSRQCSQRRTLYSYTKDDEPLNEFYKYLENEQLKLHSGHRIVVVRLMDLLIKSGFKRSLMDSDGNPEQRTFKLRDHGTPGEDGLRLFGLWFSDNLFVVGNAGLKPKDAAHRKTENNIELKRARDELAAIQTAIRAWPGYRLIDGKSDFSGLPDHFEIQEIF